MLIGRSEKCLLEPPKCFPNLDSFVGNKHPRSVDACQTFYWGKTKAVHMNVLVVDDSRVTRKIVVRELELLGIKQVDEAVDGVEAWRLFRQAPYDCVITDWNMPNMNGLDLLESIRVMDSEVPVLMITTESEKEKVIQALQSGVTDYLLKPFDEAELHQKIAKYALDFGHSPVSH